MAFVGTLPTIFPKSSENVHYDYHFKFRGFVKEKSLTLRQMSYDNRSGNSMPCSKSNMLYFLSEILSMLPTQRIGTLQQKVPLLSAHLW